MFLKPDLKGITSNKGITGVLRKCGLFALFIGNEYSWLPGLDSLRPAEQDSGLAHKLLTSREIKFQINP